MPSHNEGYAYSEQLKASGKAESIDIQLINSSVDTQPSRKLYNEPYRKAPKRLMKGRGVAENVGSRFDRYQVESMQEPSSSPNTLSSDKTASGNLQGFKKVRSSSQNDDLFDDVHSVAPVKTETISEQCKTIISYNSSPDLPFDRSINPYRGCEHGCVYCYARPSHAYWDLSPGLDFESKIIVKENAPDLLRQQLSQKNYQCRPIALGVNTDAYQPIEKQRELTRELLSILLEFKHPVTLLTKSQLILRDLDILTELAALNLVSVGVSLTSLDNRLKSLLEPRAASANARLKVMKTLVDHDIPTHAMLAPIIPCLNDSEIEKMVKAITETGVKNASYIMLRLPFEVKPLFIDWLEQHYPLKKQRVLSHLTDLRKGQLNSSEFKERFTGDGVFAQLFRSRFSLATRRFGINQTEHKALNCEDFIYNAPHQYSLI